MSAFFISIFQIKWVLGGIHYIKFNFFAKLKRVFEENYSMLEKNDLSWYRQLIIGLFIIIVVDSLCTVYEMFFPEIPWNIGTIIAFLFVGF